MAAILKLRRASTTPNLVQSELFYNDSLVTLQVGKTLIASTDVITLVKLTDSNVGNLKIVGTISGSALTLSGDITASNLTLSGNATIAGNITFGGELITLGDANTDNIVISGELSSSLIPNNDNAFDLGSSDKKYRNLYANNINGNITDINILAFTSSINTKFSTLATYTGSVDTTLSNLATKNTTLGTYTGSIDTKFSTLGTYTGSIDTKWNTIENVTASILEHTESINNKFTTLETYTESVDNSLQLINTFSASEESKNSTLASYTESVDLDIIELYSTASNHEDRIIYLSGSFSQSVDDRLDQLEVNSGSVNNSISLLNTFSASEESKNSTLSSYTESVNNNLTELFSTASDHEIRINGIQDYTSSLRTAIGINGSNVTINGDLSVLGTTTQINSTQVNIGDNILELNYGGAVNKGGIFVSDATGTLTSGSLLWNSVTDRWIAGASGSESIILLADGDNVVSSSVQVVEGLKSTFLEIEGDNVVSGSSQIDLTQTTNYISGIKTRLNSETVISGSSQVILSESADYVSAIKHRLNIESVISSSIQVDVYNTTNFTTYSASIDDKLTQLINDSASQDGRLDNLELFSASEESKNSTLANYTGSNDTKWDVLGNVTQSLINATSSYETIGRGIVSGSSQLTASYDLKYAQSESFHQLVGEWNYGIQGSIRDAAFYSVTSSAQLDTGSITSASLNDTFIFTAGATKEYVNWRTEAILYAIGAADITAVNAGSGLSGGGVSGDVTMSLDTGSTHFTDGIKTKLNTDGVISGSSQIVSILGPLNTFSSSQESKDSTLATYTGSVNSQLTELYTTSSNHETRIDNLESWSSSLDTLFVTENELTTLSSSIDSRLDNSEAFSSSINTTIKTKLNVEGVLSGSSQIVSILGPLNTFSASQESKDSTLAIYTGSVDTKFSTLGTYTGSVDTKFSTLGTYTGSVNSQLLNLINATSSYETIGRGIISGSSQLSGTTIQELTIVNLTTINETASVIFSSGSNRFGDFGDDTHAFTGSVQITGSLTAIGSLTATSFDGIINATNGVLSGSLQSQLPAGVVSGSSQITFSGISSLPTLVSGSSQITFSGISSLPTLVSGSSQITLSSTTGGSTTSNVQFGSLGVGMVASGTSGRIDATNDIVAFSSSDKRFKENITPISNALDKINQIGGYEFDWNVETKLDHGYEGHDLGVIAQEIELIAPQLVQTRENGYKAVKYDKLISVLIEAVKELSQKVNELEKSKYL